MFVKLALSRLFGLKNIQLMNFKGLQFNIQYHSAIGAAEEFIRSCTSAAKLPRSNTETSDSYFFAKFINAFSCQREQGRRYMVLLFDISAFDLSKGMLLKARKNDLE